MGDAKTNQKRKTPPKRATKAAASPRTPYSAMVEQAGDAFFVHDGSGRIVDVNPSACQLLGYSREELLERSVRDINPDLHPPHAESRWDRVKTGQQEIFESHLRRKDGTQVLVEINLSALHLSDATLFLGIVRDISKRTEVEESLRALTTRYQAILQTIPDIITEVDENDVYAWVNNAGLEFFGDDVVGRDVADYSLDPEETWAKVVPLFEGDNDTHYVETWQRRQDGENRLLAWWRRALRDQDGRVVGALSTARDVTERWQAEMTKDARLRMLELAPASTVQEFLRAALRELEYLTMSRIGFCNFWKADEATYAAGAWAALDLDDSCRIEPELVHHALSDAGVWADCVRERRPLVYNDYQNLPQRKGTPPGHAELRRILTVPVFRGDKIVAVFVVGNKATDYTEQDVQAVSSFADLAWDTAARKLAEAALLESDALNRRLFDSSPDAVVLSEPDGRFLECNQTAIDTWGYSREELLQMTYRDLAAPDLRELAGGHVTETLEQGGTLFEWRHKRKDGSELPVEIRTAPFMAQGRTRIMATVRDLTRQKAAEEALQHSEERFKSLSAMTTEGLMIHEGGVILDANQAFARLVGYEDPDELVGKNGLDILPVTPEHREHLQARIPLGASEIYELQLLRPDGTVLWAETGSRAISYRGRPARIVFMRDITLAKQAQAEQERLQAQLQQAGRMESIGRLAGGVAHDFNNMLAVILGHVELALEQVASDHPLRTDLEEIRKAANRSAGITQQLLAFARRQVTVPKVVDLNKSVEGLLSMLRRLIGEQITLVWLPAHDLGRVQIDPSQLDQVLVNLCLNARDAIPAAGQVTIQTANVLVTEEDCAGREDLVPGSYVLLSVGDNGTGISPEAMEHLFEPFFTTKELGKGSGLGLATVYGIVTQNNGFIQVDTDLERGTDVRIYLPQVSAELTPEEPEAARQVAPGGVETLLVVEDEPSVLRLTQRILSDLQYVVLTARTPSEAIRLVQEHPADIALVISDVVMPEMNGGELAKYLLTISPQLKTLFVSGYTDEILSSGGVAGERLNFLPKPFTPQDLAAAVRALLDRE